MAAIASERSSTLFCVAGKVVSSEDDILQVEFVNRRISWKQWTYP